MSFQYGISLENFKIFSDKQDFEFAPITILTGSNSSGKSTINQALRLLSKHFKNKITNVDGKIELNQLLKKIDSRDVEEKVGEFQNYLNKNYKNEI